MNTKGYLKIHTTINNNYIPIKNAKIIIYKSNQDFVDLEEILTAYTDASGIIDNIELDTPPLALSFKSGTLPYGIYNITVTAKGYKPLKVEGIQVFPNIKAFQLCKLESGDTCSCNYKKITITEHKHVSEKCSVSPKDCTIKSKNCPQIKQTMPMIMPKTQSIKPAKKKRSKKESTRVLSSVVVPSVITVHAGSPFNDSAPNYTVPFIDYIKNVGCSELYSTWDSDALRANIYCIVSFALNRIYTEWYPSQGYNFDITNDTAYDQSFVPDRNTYNTIDIIVDSLFATYIEEQGTNYPLFAQYCNGTSVTCPNWLSQWGSQYLAQEGYTPYEILTYYYGNDINLVNAPEIQGYPESYPGSPLSMWTSGPKVKQIQTQLNAISTNYPLIPTLATDGIYGPLTANSVKVYQGVFNLPQTGIVNFATWYSISKVYTAVKQFNELNV